LTYSERIEAARQAPETAVCRHCGRPKHQHGKMGYSCPPPCRKAFEERRDHG
jgi:tRNA(Ile2) C34 agmatinyltransferase TiaS